MSLLTGMKAVASSVLDKYGESVTFSREVSTGFDPVTGQDTTTTTTFSGNAHPKPYKANEIDGTVIQAKDVRLLMENMGTEPQVSDTFSHRSKTYRVMGVEPIALQGGSAAYYVQGRV